MRFGKSVFWAALLVASLFAASKPMEIVLAGPRAGLGPMLVEVRRRFLPNAIVMLAEHAPQAMPAIGDSATAYVCENYACQLPVTSAEALAEALQ